MNNQKFNLLKDPQTNWRYILIVLVLAVLAGGGILAYQYWWGWGPREEQGVEDETADWKTYTNPIYGFSVKYPDDLEVEDRSNQFPPFTIFLTDKTKQVPYEGGSKINPYALIEVKNTNLSLIDYVNDSKNNLEYVDKKKVGENEFIIAREKLGMAAGMLDQYLIKNGNSVITVVNSLYAIDGQIFNQILSTLRFLE